jgi:TolB-like protein
MTERSEASFEYEVALSFAGEDRASAQALAQALDQRGIKFFYDDYEKAKLWGQNLYTFLLDLYQNKARFCVMFLSQHYATKMWTNLERQGAQARAAQERGVYILPIRLDKTEIPGLLHTVGYLDWPPEDAESVAETIASMLGRSGESSSIPRRFRAKARPRWWLAALVLAFGLILAANQLWNRLDRHRVPVSVAVLDFDCNGFGYGFAAGLSEMLAAALRLEQDVRVIDRRWVYEAEEDLKLSPLRSDDEPEHFRRNLDADFLVSGSCGPRAAGSSAVTVRFVLTPASERSEFLSERYSGSFSNPAYLVARLASEIRSRLRTGGTSPEKVTEALQRLFPRDPEALAGYFEGLARLQRFESEEASKALEAAAKSEAHPKILRLQAVALWDQGDNSALEKAKAAEDATRDFHLPRREELEIITTRANIEGKLKDEIQAYAELHDSFPWELHYGLSLADAQRAADEIGASLETLSDLRRQWASPAALARIDYQHADLLLSKERFLEAATIADRAAAEAREASSPSLEARVSLILAQIDSTGGRHIAAIERLKRALPVFQASRDRDLELTCQELLAIESFALGKTPQLDRLRKEYQKMGNQEGQGRLFHLAGAMALERGDYVAAEKLLKQALKTFRSLGEAGRVSEAIVLAERAFLFFAWGRPVESARLADEALSLYNDLKEADGIGTAVQVLSEIEYYQGRLAAAEEHQRSALAEHNRVGSWERGAFGKYRLGMIYAQNGKPAARACLQAGVNEQQHPLYLAEALLGLSLFETLEGHPEEGLKLANQAAKDLSSAKGTWRGEPVRLARINAFLAQGATDLALTEARALRNAAWEQKDFRVRFEQGILVARLEAATDKPVGRARALASLSQIAEDARRAGYVLYEMEAQLARGEILLWAGGGTAARGRVELKSLAREAAGAGLSRFVARAEKALGVAPGASRLRAVGPRVRATPPLSCEG